MWTCGPSERQREEVRARAQLAGAASAATRNRIAHIVCVIAHQHSCSHSLQLAASRQRVLLSALVSHMSLKYDVQHGKCWRYTRGLGLCI